EKDFAAFSECLFDFNVRVGEGFSLSQGGRYAHRDAESTIAFLRANGVRGVGQSSWGPTLFAATEDEEAATYWSGRLRDQFWFSGKEVLITQARNCGASVSAP